MKENLRELRNIEDKYGVMVLGMGLTHLVDIGMRNFADIDVDESVKQILAKGEADSANGNVAILTAELQCEILRCASALSHFSIWALFAYIKKYVNIGGL